MTKIDKLLKDLTERVNKELEKESLSTTELKEITICASILKEKELRQQEDDKSN